MALLVLSLGALAVMWWHTHMADRQSEDFRISGRFSARIAVTEESDDATETRPVRRLGRFEDLVHLSDVFGRLIVQRNFTGGSTYTVDGDVSYV